MASARKGVKRGAGGGGESDAKRGEASGGGVMTVDEVILALHVFVGASPSVFHALDINTLANLVDKPDKNTQKTLDAACDNLYNYNDDGSIIVTSIDNGSAFSVSNSHIHGTVSRKNVITVLSVITNAPSVRVVHVISNTTTFHKILDDSGFVHEILTRFPFWGHEHMCRTYMLQRLELCDDASVVELLNHHSSNSTMMQQLVGLVDYRYLKVSRSSEFIVAVHAAMRQHFVDTCTADAGNIRRTCKLVCEHINILANQREYVGETLAAVAETMAAVADISIEATNSLIDELAHYIFFVINRISNCGILSVEYQGTPWAAHVFARVFGVHTTANALEDMIMDDDDALCKAISSCLVAGSVNALSHFIRFVNRVCGTTSLSFWQILFMDVDTKLMQANYIDMQRLHFGVMDVVQGRMNVISHLRILRNPIAAGSSSDHFVKYFPNHAVVIARLLMIRNRLVNNTHSDIPFLPNEMIIYISGFIIQTYNQFESIDLSDLSCALQSLSA